MAKKIEGLFLDVNFEKSSFDGKHYLILKGNFNGDDGWHPGYQVTEKQPHIGKFTFRAQTDSNHHALFYGAKLSANVTTDSPSVFKRMASQLDKFNRALEKMRIAEPISSNFSDDMPDNRSVDLLNRICKVTGATLRYMKEDDNSKIRFDINRYIADWRSDHVKKELQA